MINDAQDTVLYHTVQYCGTMLQKCTLTVAHSEQSQSQSHVTEHSHAFSSTRTLPRSRFFRALPSLQACAAAWECQTPLTCCFCTGTLGPLLEVRAMSFECSSRFSCSSIWRLYSVIIHIGNGEKNKRHSVSVFHQLQHLAPGRCHSQNRRHKQEMQRSVSRVTLHRASTAPVPAPERALTARASCASPSAWPPSPG